jgi:hypothetical protein
LLDIVFAVGERGGEGSDDKTKEKNHPGSMRCHSQNQTLAWLPMQKEAR